ncbi:DUF2807 domain-containing protein [Chitinispirillales bacterium ANBcel5]|uniref:GIN domain-containing protein n=1 Tax=Cellulosispirillum alkaliphilum TaxID=3039283 RepID=UPI002A587204|nr:DUF2807 domain-containing protein [Chitinispirillales bacterium ANBcel5]
MDRKILSLLFISPVIFILSCAMPTIYGSGNSKEISYAIAEFNSLYVSDGCKVTLVQSDTHFVTVTIDENIERFVQVETINGELKLSLRAGWEYNRVQFSAHIGVPDLEYIKATEFAQIHLQAPPFSERPLSIDLSSYSQMSGSISARDITVHLSGRSKLELRGKAHTLTVTGRNSSKASLFNLNTHNSSIILRDNSVAEIVSSGVISGFLSDQSTLYYRGHVDSLERQGASRLIEAGGL